MRMSGFRQQTYSDQVDDYIKGRILSGDLAPDALITQVPIAAELSFSRAPVREAMQKLVRDGLIESHPKKGKNVTALMENQIKIDSSLRTDSLAGMQMQSTNQFDTSKAFHLFPCQPQNPLKMPSLPLKLRF